jgi:hypothetical protein
VSPGPVELAVEAELQTLPVAQLRPTVAAVAAAMAKILDGRVPTSEAGGGKSAGGRARHVAQRLGAGAPRQRGRGQVDDDEFTIVVAHRLAALV